MVRFVKVYVNTRDSLVWILVLVITMVFMVALLLYLGPIPYRDPLDRLRSVSATLVIGTILLYLLYTLRVVKREYTVLSDLLEKIVVKDSKIVIPVDNVEKQYISILRSMYRGRYKTSIRFGEKEKTDNEIDLNRVSPYVFIGKKSNIIRQKLSDALTETYYEGYGYVFKYRGIEFLLIPLYSVDPGLREKILKISSMRDYGEAHIDLDKNTLIIRMYYMKDSTRSLRLELCSKGYVELVLYRVVLCSLEDQGSRECRIDLPRLTKPHIILVPNDPKFLNSIELPLSGFTYTGKLLDNVFVLGFNDLVLRLVLDIPHKKDVYSEVKLETKT